MQNSVKKYLLDLWSMRNKIIFYAVFLLLIFYGIFDITTSRQTLHLTSNRLASQITLILLNVTLLFGISFFISSLLKRKINIFKSLFKIEDCFVFVSIFGLILCALLSVLINGTSLKDFFTQVIYLTTFLLMTLYLFIASKELDMDHSKETFLLLLVYFIYYFFLLFYYFYLRGSPTISGALRVPVLSHVFFPMSLIPSLRSYLKTKIFWIYFLSIPLILLADKASVFIVFFAYFFSDLFFSPFYEKHKAIFRISISSILLVFIGLVVYANIDTNSFLASKLSYSAVIYKSGRLQNWTNISSDFKNFSSIQYVFGKGTSSTLLVNEGTAAHNDFLEYFYDYGILGLMFAILFWVGFLIKLIKEFNQKEINWLMLFLYITLLMGVSAIFSNANILLTFAMSGFAFDRNKSITDVKEDPTVVSTDLKLENS